MPCKWPGVPRGHPPGMADDKCINHYISLNQYEQGRGKLKECLDCKARKTENPPVTGNFYLQ